MSDNNPVGFTVRRWRRWGLTRWYVNTVEGETLGWVDPVTGRVEVSDERMRPLADLLAAVAEGAAATATANTPALNSDAEGDGSDGGGSGTPTGAAEGTNPANPSPTPADAPTSRLQAAAAPAGSSARNGPARDLAAREPGQHLRAAEAAFRAGREGEEHVGQLITDWLATPAGANWQALHSVPVGKRGNGDLDHVLVGPGGLVVVNTKNTSGLPAVNGSGDVSVNARRTGWMERAREDQRMAQARLWQAGFAAIPVLSAVAVVHESVATLWHAAWGVDVVVVDADRLTDWVGMLPPILSRSSVEGLWAAVQDPRTWTRPILTPAFHQREATP